MTKTELRELIANGENSGVELKRDDVSPERIAQRIAALLNLEGGYILLGVEQDRTVSGLTRGSEKAEEWVMNIARDHVRPSPIPYWQTLEVEPGKTVGVISLPADSPDKPYKAKRGSAWVTMIRAGTQTRDATDEEEVRLYQQSGRLRYDIKPVIGASQKDLDRRRLENYFRDIREQHCPDAHDEAGWTRLLLNTDLAVEDRERVIPTVAAILAFGRNPNRHLPQAGVAAAAYPGTEKDYEAKGRAVLRGPMVALRSRDGEVVEAGVIEQAMEFVRRNTAIEAWLEGAQRRERWEYPSEAVREAVVNAIAHRDYTITVTDMELSIDAKTSTIGEKTFTDYRIEVLNKSDEDVGEVVIKLWGGKGVPSKRLSFTDLDAGERKHKTIGWAGKKKPKGKIEAVREEEPTEKVKANPGPPREDRVSSCKSCFGRRSFKCRRCRGRGYLVKRGYKKEGEFEKPTSKRVDCNRCGGDGRVSCKRCGGRSYTKRSNR